MPCCSQFGKESIKMSKHAYHNDKISACGANNLLFVAQLEGMLNLRRSLASGLLSLLEATY